MIKFKWDTLQINYKGLFWMQKQKNKNSRQVGHQKGNNTDWDGKINYKNVLFADIKLYLLLVQVLEDKIMNYLCWMSIVLWISTREGLELRFRYWQRIEEPSSRLVSNEFTSFHLQERTRREFSDLFKEINIIKTSEYQVECLLS